MNSGSDQWELTAITKHHLMVMLQSCDAHPSLWTGRLVSTWRSCDADMVLTWQGTSNISGLISGNLVITHKGILSITGHTSGATIHLTFKEPGMFSSKKAIKHEVRFPSP